jgi:hypothetical protein
MATTGIDQTTANKVLDALTPAATSGTTTVGSLTITAPIKCRFCSSMTTTDSGASTEWPTSGGYVAGGVSVGTGWAAAAGGSKATTTFRSILQQRPPSRWLTLLLRLGQVTSCGILQQPPSELSGVPSRVVPRL